MINSNSKSMGQNLNLTFTSYSLLSGSLRGMIYIESAFYNNSLYVLSKRQTSSGNQYPSLFKIDSNGICTELEIFQSCDLAFNGRLFVSKGKLNIVYKCFSYSKSEIFELIIIENEIIQREFISEEYFTKNVMESLPFIIDNDLRTIKDINDSSLVLYKNFKFEDGNNCMIASKQNPGSVELPPFNIYCESLDNILIAFYRKVQSPILYLRGFSGSLNNYVHIDSPRDLFLDINYASFNTSDTLLNETKLQFCSDTNFFSENTATFDLFMKDDGKMQFQINDSIPTNKYYIRLINPIIKNIVNNNNQITLSNNLHEAYLKRIELTKQEKEKKDKRVIFGFQFFAFLMVFIWTYLVFNYPSYSKFYYFSNLNAPVKKFIEMCLYGVFGAGAVWGLLIEFLKSFTSEKNNF